MTERRIERRTADDELPGWYLNLRQRARILRGRAVVQKPTDEDQAVVRAIAAAGPREGIPFDVLLTLEALRQLAEQGNLVARNLYDRERERLGIDRPRHHGTEAS